MRLNRVGNGYVRLSRVGNGDMRLSRVHVAEPVAGRAQITLGGTAANHIAKVLRLGVGDEITIFDNTGGEYPAVIDALSRDGVRVSVGGHRDIERESPLDITLAQGVSRGERMDLVVQKATELGVRRIVPLLAERTVVRLQADQAASRLRHWQAIAAAACEQCGRNRLPQISAPLGLQEFLDSALARGVRLMLVPGATLRVRNLAAGATAVTLLIGPEGGLSEAEYAAATAASFDALSLGPRILRTETAALAALAAIQQQLGDL